MPSRQYNDLCVSFSENQQFLKDIIASVLDGQGVGFWKLGRVKKLMEDENYRNFVVSRLNTSLDRKLTDEDQHLEDVVRLSRLNIIISTFFCFFMVNIY